MTDYAARKLMAEMILQAVEDVDLSARYKTPGKNEAALYDQRTAVHFLRSKFFVELCGELGWAADQIRRKAFSTKPQNTHRRIDHD